MWKGEVVSQIQVFTMIAYSIALTSLLYGSCQPLQAPPAPNLPKPPLRSVQP